MSKFLQFVTQGCIQGHLFVDSLGDVIIDVDVRPL